MSVQAARREEEEKKKKKGKRKGLGGLSPEKKKLLKVSDFCFRDHGQWLEVHINCQGKSPPLALAKVVITSGSVLFLQRVEDRCRIRVIVALPAYRGYVREQH